MTGSATILSLWALGLAWHLGLALFALGYAFAGVPQSALGWMITTGVLVVAPLVFRLLRREVSQPSHLMRSGLLGLVALIFFLDFGNGGFVSTGGADSGNHWMIYWSLLAGDRMAYEGFTAFHWGVEFWRNLIPGIAGFHSVTLTALFSAWLGLSLFAQLWIKRGRALEYLLFVSAAVSLRVLVGEGYYSQAFSWPIHALIWLWVSQARAPLTTAQVILLGGWIASLRGIYGGDLPLLLTTAGIWVLSSRPRQRWNLALGALYTASGGVGLFLLSKLMALGGGFLRFGSNEALILLGLGAILTWFYPRGRGAYPADKRFWRIFISVAAAYLVVIFLSVQTLEYYFVKLLLLTSLLALSGWVDRVKRAGTAVWLLAWALIFQRYLVLTLAWFFTQIKPTDALLPARTEIWLRAQTQTRQCSSYLYVTGSWARFNWANHVLSGNFAVNLHMGNYLRSLDQTPPSIRPDCVFVERNTDRQATHPRIKPNWQCLDSGVSSVGEVCAAPQN